MRILQAFGSTLRTKSGRSCVLQHWEGWKDVGTVMKFHAHAMDDPTITDVLFGTK